MIVEFLVTCKLLIVFFFSSRRRHTRSLRDWSSDVCSSDLGLQTSCSNPGSVSSADRVPPPIVSRPSSTTTEAPRLANSTRSEERRVGKECRSRWVPVPQKKNTQHLFNRYCMYETPKSNHSD